MADIKMSSMSGTPFGNTANRPATPDIGQTYHNGETGVTEIYTSLGWVTNNAAPASPTIGTATAVTSGRAYNNGAASITFTPGSGGGYPATYTMTSSPGSYTGTASTSPVTVTGLQSNTAYTFTLSSTNNYATSVAATVSNSITATTVPQAPTIGAVTPSVGSASVAYTANATGGSAVTTYTATSSPGGFTGTGTSPIIVSGLTNGASYTFTVTATNANGTSAASSASSSTTILTPFAGGNQSVASLYNLMSGMGVGNSVAPSAGGTLSVNSVALGSYDYTLKSGDQTVSSFTNSDWFTTTADTRSALIKVQGNLTINSGQTFIPSNRKLFTCIYIDGNLILNGSISMTARGANHSGTGNSGGATTKGNILLISGTRSGIVNPQIPATGGAGGYDPRASEGSTYGGDYPGVAGTAGGTGGGSSGYRIRIRPGKGGDGTSFSGGTGSSATDTYDINGQPDGNAGGENGGAGANARNFDGYTRAVSGGAGNPGGVGAGNLSVPPYGSAGSDGTGGVVIVFVTGTISGTGSIVANGSNGGQSGFYGGGSGGGSVNVFYGTDSFSGGSLTANGGLGHSTAPAGAGTARKLSIV